MPVNARNVLSITQWIVPVSLTSVMPRLRELAASNRTAADRAGRETHPPRDARRRARTAWTSAGCSHAAGAGLLWAAVAPAELLPRACTAYGRAPGTLLQVTNLGITVKDSPQSTLVFVTRLDTGAPVPEARVAIVDSGEPRAVARDDRSRRRGAGAGDDAAPAAAWQTLLHRDGGEGRRPRLRRLELDQRPASLGRTPDYQLNEADDVLRGSVFTDRGVYREHEEVHVKAVLRDDTPAGMRLLPAGTALEVLVHDGRGREVDRRT